MKKLILCSLFFAAPLWAAGQASSKEWSKVLAEDWQNIKTMLQKYRAIPPKEHWIYSIAQDDWALVEQTKSIDPAFYDLLATTVLPDYGAFESVRNRDDFLLELDYVFPFLFGTGPLTAKQIELTNDIFEIIGPKAPTGKKIKERLNERIKKAAPQRIAPVQPAPRPSVGAKPTPAPKGQAVIIPHDVRTQLEKYKKMLEGMTSSTFDFSKPKTDQEKIDFAQTVIWTAERNRLVAVEEIIGFIGQNNLPIDEKLHAEYDAIHEKADKGFIALGRLSGKKVTMLESLGFGETDFERAKSTLPLTTDLVKKALEIVNSVLTGTQAAPQQSQQAPVLLGTSIMWPNIRLKIEAIKKFLEESSKATFDFSKPQTEREKNDLALKVDTIQGDRQEQMGTLRRLIRDNKLPVTEDAYNELNKKYAKAQEAYVAQLRMLGKTISLEDSLGYGRTTIERAQSTFAVSNEAVNTALKVINSLGI